MPLSTGPPDSPGNGFPRKSADHLRAESQPGYHAVKFYSSDLDLIKTAGPFLAGSLTSGEGAAIIARERITDGLLRDLRRHDIDVEAARSNGSLLLVDVDQFIVATCTGGRPDPARFESFTADLTTPHPVHRRFGRIRVYCEAATELCGAGDPTAAIEFERLWIQFLTGSGCGILCGYDVNDFSRDAHPKAYVEICSLHVRVQHERDLIGIVREMKDEFEGLRRQADDLAIAMRERMPDAEENSDQHRETLQRFAAGVARIFDDSLTLVLGWGELLGRLDLPLDEQSAMSREIAKAATRAGAMSRGLFAFGERGASDLGVVRAADGVRDAWRLIAMSAGKRIQTSLDIDADAGTIAVHRNELAEIVLALGLGGLQRVDDGGRIQLQVKRLEVATPGEPWIDLPPGSYVQLAVWDDGRRATDALAPSNVEQLVADCGGKLRARTSPEHGTLVRVALPAAPEPSPSERSAPEEESPDATILVLASRPALRRMIVMQLEALGHRVIACADRNQASAGLESYPPIDCLVIDPAFGVDDERIIAELSQRFPQMRLLLIVGRADKDSDLLRRISTRAPRCSKSRLTRKSWSGASRRCFGLIEGD